PTSEVLVVTDWSRRVGFYDLDGNSVKREDMVLNYDPTCVEFIPSGQFLLIGGSGRQVIGGPPGRETILIGLREGQVCKLFVDNPFPVQVLKLNGPIKCIDISATRRHIAVVDDSGLCVVFDAKTKEVLFEEPNCNSVAFNSDNEEIICYSGSSKLTVRARGYPGHQQRMFGFVVGFSGNKVYCLHIYAMQALEVPFSNQLYQYIENKEYQKAYDLACLGVTREDWQILAMDAISNLNCEIALKAFARYKDYRSIQLVHEIKHITKQVVTKKLYAYWNSLLVMLLMKIALLMPAKCFAEKISEKANQPFTRHSPETLLNMARYLAAQQPVPNISQVLICYTIARIGRELGAYKLARDTLDRLGSLRVPPRLQRDVELMTVNIRAKPFSDADDLLPKKATEVCLNADDLARLEKGQVFHSDDFEMAVLQEGHCPFCRSVQERSDNPYLIDES
ncbi:hypothetical protein TELCIR_15111, partial [Teladorsagia circumcincta]